MNNAFQKYYTLIAVCLYSWGSMANPPLATKKQVEAFRNTTTCVVLENDNISYSTNIKDAVQKYWKSTKFEFIGLKEFDSMRSDPRYSFILLTNRVFDKDPAGISYTCLSLLLADTAKDINNMPELCSVPVSYSDDNNADLSYVIPSVVQFMQKHCINLENRHLLIAISGLTYYNGSKQITDKVLLLNKHRMAKNADSVEKIRKVYEFQVKLLTDAEIETELAANGNVLFDYHVGPQAGAAAGKCFDMIFDTAGNLYYFHGRQITNMQEDGFNLDDFNRIR